LADIATNPEIRDVLDELAQELEEAAAVIEGHEHVAGRDPDSD
jgi:hypothetical protein